jgi:RNA polymerase sigma-70 factor (ECF subfamily)
MTDWPELIREHGPLVWRTAYRLLNHDADAADCFQRTFLAAVEIERKQQVRCWLALLKRLATARALEQLRQRHRRKTRSEPWPENSPADSRADDPLQAAVGGELAGRLRDALAEIDPLQADVFCLTCLEGLSYAEVAEQLGITTNHAGVLLSRARAALREKLAVFLSGGVS